MELLSTFTYGPLKVETFYIGSDHVANKTYLNDKLIYEDQTFRPSPLHDQDSIDCMVSLLDFLMIRHTDVDPGYFISRNCPILDDFAYTDEADEIRSMVNDFMLQRDFPETMEENELTKEYCTRIENFIS